MAQDGKESACSAGDAGSIPGSGRSPGEGNDNPLQCSCLRNPMNRGAWQRTPYSPCGRKESDTTESLTLFFFLTLCEKTLSHIPLTSWMLLNCSAGQELFIPFYRWGNWVVSLRSYHWSHRVRTLLSRLPDSPGTVLSPSHAYSPPINQKLRNAATLGQWKNCPVWWDGCLIILRIQSRKGLRNYIYTP